MFFIYPLQTIFPLSDDDTLQVKAVDLRNARSEADHSIYRKKPIFRAEGATR
jgi:hypothetical protein